MRNAVKALVFAVGAIAILVQPNADAAINPADPLDWHVAGVGPDLAQLARPLGQLAIGANEVETFSDRFESEIDALAKWSQMPNALADVPAGDQKQGRASPFDTPPERLQKSEDVPLPRARPREPAAFPLRQHAIVDPRAFGGGPRPVRIALGDAVLAPMAHVRFCQANPADCRREKIVFRGGLIDLTPERLDELKAVNISVNRAIHAQDMHEPVAAEKWLILPKVGDCNDYAVSKRHELLARGWPARSLLLAEVITSWGEHHLVLVVRTRQGDLVADNLNPKIRAWSATPYEWVRIQTPQNPTFWAAMRRAPSA
jgi:predicted transglutaminase-like cysteine proteinase